MKKILIILPILLILGLSIAYLRPPIQPDDDLSQVPLLSQTEIMTDQSILLAAPAPLPKPCQKDREKVEFCTEPTSLFMKRGRYDFFAQTWGLRHSEKSRIEKLVQLSENLWEFRLGPDSEKPLVWLDNNHSGSLRFYPVSPLIDEIRTFQSQDFAPEVIPEGSQDLRVDFDRGSFLNPKKIILRWISETRLQVEFRPLDDPLTIIIDPGHGGKEKGAQAPSFPSESELALKAAEALAGELRQLGAQATLIRETDHEVSLAERLAFALDPGNDLFVSLHFDAAEAYSGPRPVCFFGRFDLYKLCSAISKQIEGLIPGEPVSPARKYFFVLQSPVIPSILIEIANLKNPAHHALLNQDFDQFISSWAKQTAQSLTSYGQQ